MSETSRLRPEIQALRAVAVVAVVGDHLFPGIVRGGYIGVDVFFVISGYLISSHLLRELDRTGRLRFGRFWARRARRLVPASAVVLATCVVATVLVVPQALWKEVMRQIAASALFFQNWTLAHDAQDYFRSAESPSPATHYWSLSLEEQFYVVWPLLVFAAYVVGRRLGHRRLALAVGFGAVVAASLVFSIVYTAHDPNPAYFVTPARMWQLGAGGLLALLPASLATAPARLRHLTGALGWAAIVVAVFGFTATTAVPGWIALVPVLGACLVIWSGDAYMTSRAPAARGAVAVAGWFGGISYSLYLWHWPLIVLVPYADGHRLTPAAKLAVLVASVLVAWASARLVEDPVRRWRPLALGAAYRSLVPALLALGLVVGAANAAGSLVDHRIQRITRLVDAKASSSIAPCFGARAIAHGCAAPHLLRLHDSALLDVLDYRAPLHNGRSCLQDHAVAAVTACEFGAADPGATRVALVGDSHAHQWAPALDDLAIKHDWRIVELAKSSCPFDAAAVVAPFFPEGADGCHAWRDAVLHRLVADRSIRVVFTSSISRSYDVAGMQGPAGRQAMIDGYRSLWARLVAAGKTVVVLGDLPRMGRRDLPSCVAEAPTNRDPCTVPTSVALTGDPLLQAARGMHERHVVPVDLHRFFCDAHRCHAVVGGIVAYGDANHMIGYFARTLAPYLDRRLPRRLTVHE